MPTLVEQSADVADWRTGQLSGPTTSKAGEFAGAGRTMCTSARLLYDVLTFVYDRLGFDIIADPVFEDLSSPGSSNRPRRSMRCACSTTPVRIRCRTK
ncbi:hypothetical protein G6038_14935 [Rhodococcus sp. 14C212]|nr:hypothetical protein [Rhodococcus sp. 14C212]